MWLLCWLVSSHRKIANHFSFTCMLCPLLCFGLFQSLDILCSEKGCDCSPERPQRQLWPLLPAIVLSSAGFVSWTLPRYPHSVLSTPVYFQDALATSILITFKSMLVLGLIFLSFVLHFFRKICSFSLFVIAREAAGLC